MKNYEKVSWLKVHDYLLQVGSCRTIPEFLHAVCTEVEKVIPFDSASGFLCNSDGTWLHAIGTSESVRASYNHYYRTTQPAFLSKDAKHPDFEVFLAKPVANWRDYHNFEFAVDFMIPNGFWKSLARPFPEQPITLSIQRSRLSPDFSDSDVTVLDLLNLHLNNFWSLLTAGEATKNGPVLSGREIGEKFRVLTSREAELCSFVALRLSTGEIAARLFISPRTVEKHVEDIFEKLDVHSRDQLRQKLGVQGPIYGESHSVIASSPPGLA